MDFHGIPQNSMEIHGILINSIEIHEIPYNSNGVSVFSHVLYVSIFSTCSTLFYMCLHFLHVLHMRCLLRSLQFSTCSTTSYGFYCILRFVHFFRHVKTCSAFSTCSTSSTCFYVFLHIFDIFLHVPRRVAVFFFARFRRFPPRQKITKQYQSRSTEDYFKKKMCFLGSTTFSLYFSLRESPARPPRFCNAAREHTEINSFLSFYTIFVPAGITVQLVSVAPFV